MVVMSIVLYLVIYFNFLYLQANNGKSINIDRHLARSKDMCLSSLIFSYQDILCAKWKSNRSLVHKSIFEGQWISI